MKSSKEVTQQEVTQKPTEKKESKLGAKLVTLFHNSAKKEGGQSYLSGKVEGGEMVLVGFYNTYKKKHNAPDIMIYEHFADGGHSKDPVITLWDNERYLSGVDNEKNRVVAFRNQSKDKKYKMVNIYLEKGE